MNIKGTYKFKINDKVILEGENLITLLGRSFFMNRWLNDEFNPIQYIMLGTGTTRPVKTDTKLGILKLTKQCTSTTDLKNSKVTLQCNCTAEEVVNTSEIGVSNGDILISHDIYEPITLDLLGGEQTSNITIEYTFQLETGGVRSNWIPSNSYNGAYYIYEPNLVVGVVEEDTGNGYKKVEDITNLENGTYYYDNDSKNLYIKTYSKNPNNMTMIVNTK